jgi:type I restriction enzyme S subunit
VIDTAYYVEPKNELDMRWLYYAIKHYNLGEIDDGSPIPSTTRTAVYMGELDVPPPGEQRAIAHILGSLDDKIGLNRRMNETLEAIALALFKSWFVNFDPVRAKLEGREPRLSEQLADLFPAAFEASQMGEIPRGWRRCKWGDLASLEYGKSLSNYAENNEAFPVFGTNGKIGTCSQALCNYPGIVVGRKGAYRGIHFSNTPFFVIDTAFYVKPKEPIELRWAYYELLRHDINGMDSGSAIPSTSREDVYSLPVLAPPLELQRSFVMLLNPFWARQEKSAEESSTLAALRDTLLPKLISGELRIKDTEKLVGSAG